MGNVDDLQWFLEQTPQGVVTSINLFAPYSEALTQKIRGDKSSRTGGLPRCTQTFNREEKYWSLRPKGRADFTTDARQELTLALQRLKDFYAKELENESSQFKSEAWRFRASALDLGEDYTGEHEAFGIRHIFENGKWVGGTTFGPIHIPAGMWVWVPDGMPYGLSLSPSAITTIEECPYKFFLQRVIGLKQPTKVQQHIGTAAHKGCEDLHNVYVNNGSITNQHLSEAEAVALTYLTSEKELASLEQKETPESIGRYNMSIVRMLQGYAAYLLSLPPHIQILQVEKALHAPTGLSIDLPDCKLDIYLTGTPDLVTTDQVKQRNRIEDVKSSLMLASSDLSERIMKSYSQLEHYVVLAGLNASTMPPIHDLIFRDVHAIGGVRPLEIDISDPDWMQQAVTRVKTSVSLAANYFQKGEFPRKQGYKCTNCPYRKYCYRGLPISNKATVFPFSKSPIK